MIVTSSHKYIGSFTDRFGTTYTINIEAPTLTADKELTFGPDPMQLSWSASGLYEGAVGKTLSVQLVCSSYDMYDLYSASSLGVAVKVWKGSDLFFYGFVSRAEYDQEYSNYPHTITFEALDPIALADSRKYAHELTAERKCLHFYELLEKFCDEVGITTIYDGAWNLTAIFGEDAFLPEDHTEEYRTSSGWKSWGDVLKGIGTSFGVNIFVWADSLYACPIAQDTDETSTFYAYKYVKGTTWAKSGSSYVNVPMLIGDTISESEISDFDVTSAKVSIMPAYSYCSVKVDASEYRSPIPDPCDESRWIGNMDIWPTDQDFDISETDDEKVTGSILTIAEDDKPSYYNTKVCEPYNLDYYGEFVLVKTYTKKEYTDTLGATYYKWVLSSSKITFNNVTLRTEARRTMPVSPSEGNMYVEFPADGNLGPYGIVQSDSVAVITVNGTSYYAYRQNYSPDSDSDARQYFSTVPAGTWAVTLRGKRIEGVTYGEELVDDAASSQDVSLGNDTIDETSISPLCRYPLSEYKVKSKVGYKSDMGADYIPSLDTLSRTHRLFELDFIQPGKFIAPFVSGKFNGNVGQILGADCNLRDAEYNVNFMLNETSTPTPTPATYRIVSMDGVYLTSSGSGVINERGENVVLYVRIVCTITDGTTTSTYNGTPAGLSSYNLYASYTINSKMYIAGDEVDPRGYTISGNTITFDEWAAEEIDERQVSVWVTCWSVSSSTNTFTQYPNVED